MSPGLCFSFFFHLGVQISVLTTFSDQSWSDGHKMDPAEALASNSPRFKSHGEKELFPSSSSKSLCKIPKIHPDESGHMLFLEQIIAWPWEHVMLIGGGWVMRSTFRSWWGSPYGRIKSWRKGLMNVEWLKGHMSTLGSLIFCLRSTFPKSRCNQNFQIPFQRKRHWTKIDLGHSLEPTLICCWRLLALVFSSLTMGIVIALSSAQCSDRCTCDFCKWESGLFFISRLLLCYPPRRCQPNEDLLSSYLFLPLQGGASNTWTLTRCP